MTLLTIAIPTYKREKSLERCISAVLYGLSPEEMKKIIILISDNDPSSNAEEMINQFSKKENLKIHYHKNLENIGADRNFVQCIELAQDSDFFWLLGDDDYPNKGVVSGLLTALEKHSPDCSFLECRGRTWSWISGIFLPQTPYIVTSRTCFLSFVNFHTTFISAFVLKLNTMKSCLKDSARPVGTNLDQLGWILPSIEMSICLMVFPGNAFDGGEESTGGYNFEKVFVRNFFSIWNESFKSSTIKCLKLVTIFMKLLMLVSFYPQVLFSEKSNNKYRFSEGSKSFPRFQIFLQEFKFSIIFWLFVAPIFWCPAAIGKLVLLLTKPFRLILISSAILNQSVGLLLSRENGKNPN
jgi:glycosyltransferase involved in cell wall biosynthesis